MTGTLTRHTAIALATAAAGLGIGYTILAGTPVAAAQGIPCEQWQAMHPGWPCIDTPTPPPVPPGGPPTVSTPPPLPSQTPGLPSQPGGGGGTGAGALTPPPVGPGNGTPIVPVPGPGADTPVLPGNQPSVIAPAAAPSPSGEIPATGPVSQPDQTPSPGAVQAPPASDTGAPPAVIATVPTPTPEVAVPASSSGSGDSSVDPRLIALAVVGATAFISRPTRSLSRNGGVKFVNGSVVPVRQAPSSPNGPPQPSVANTTILFPSTRAGIVPKQPSTSPVISDGEVRFVPGEPGSETGAIIINREEFAPPGSISRSTGYDVWVDGQYQHVDAMQSGPGLYPARIENVRSGSTVRIKQTVVTTWTDGRGQNRVQSDFDTTVSPYAPRLNQGKQDKHIPGTNNYIPGKSIWTDPDPQGLLDKYCGTGQQATPKFDIPTPGSKERVNFGKVIGQFYDPESGQYTPTTKGMIIYSSTGEHIIPAAP